MSKNEWRSIANPPPLTYEDKEGRVSDHVLVTNCDGTMYGIAYFVVDVFSPRGDWEVCWQDINWGEKVLSYWMELPKLTKAWEVRDGTTNGK